MGKRKEIRETLLDWANDICLFRKDECLYLSDYGYCVNDEGAYKCLMKKLDLQGVVILESGTDATQVKRLING